MRTSEEINIFSNYRNTREEVKGVIENLHEKEDVEKKIKYRLSWKLLRNLKIIIRDKKNFDSTTVYKKIKSSPYTIYNRNWPTTFGLS